MADDDFCGALGCGRKEAWMKESAGDSKAKKLKVKFQLIFKRTDWRL
jgi:hypothetical protein